MEPSAQPNRLDLASLKKTSRTAVLGIIRSRGQIGRREISHLTGLSFATVCRAIDELVEESLVRETESVRIGRAKRKTILLDINPQGGWVISLDIGGSRIRCAAMDLSGDIRQSLEVPLENVSGEESVVPALSSALEGIATRSKGLKGAPLACGISSSGIVDPRTGTVKLSFNLQLRDFPIARVVQGLCNTPAVVYHDVAASALAEAKLGKGRQIPDFAYITVGAGVGAGIVIGGQLREMPLDAEFGLMLVAPQGDPERFGGRGYLESLASGRSIATAARRELEAGARSQLANMAPASITAQAVAQAARQGDGLAQSILTSAAHYLGIGIVNLAHTNGLSHFIIGGGVSMAGEAFWEPLRRAVEQYEYWPGRIKLEPSQLGKDAAVLGAGILAIDHALETFKM